MIVLKSEEVLLHKKNIKKYFKKWHSVLRNKHYVSEEQSQLSM